MVDEKIIKFGQYLLNEYEVIHKKVQEERLNCDDSSWNPNVSYQRAKAREELIAETIREFENTFGKILLLGK